MFEQYSEDFALANFFAAIAGCTDSSLPLL